MNKLFLSGMCVGCAQHKVKDYGKHEILLLETFLLYIYLPPDWLGKYLGTYHNNFTRILVQ